MLELTGTWSRRSKVAALALLLLLGAAVFATYRAAGSVAALALLAISSATVLVLVIFVARRRLREAAERSRLGEQALDAIPHAIFIVEALRRGSPNLHVNAAYSALTGYDAREAVDASFDALSIFADTDDVAALDGDAELATTARVNVRRRDGGTVLAKLALHAVPRKSGGRYLVGSLERIQAGERTADRKPSGTADAPGRAKDAFLSWLNHELRSPLNACIMWLDVLALAPQPAKLTQGVEAIKRNLARQTRLVNDLNDAAKVAASGIELRLGPLDGVALLKRNLDGWQLLAIGKQLAFHHSVELETAPIDGDAERLLQALNHLIESAIASTPAGGRLAVRLHGAGANCIIEVDDSGVALSPEDAANLAVPLWRAPTSARARSGLGLGLAVAHHIAANHGGSLVAASNASGTRFTLTLPLAARDGNADPVVQVDRTSQP